ncbi:MAG: ribF [Nitrospirae bacterium]|nr:ribF [Nitrospirota bacterium]MBS1232765.1 ribF [Nitrospirota bacterium]
MEIVVGLEALNKIYPDTVLTIGNYDGVHLGHQKILSTVVKRAGEIKGTSMVMTFEPHPVKVIAPERNIKLLTTTEEKARLIETMGIHVLLLINFNKEFSSMLPDDFINEVLIKKIKVREIIVGTNYTFGKHKKGTIDLLRKRGKSFGFDVQAIRNVMVHGNIVSSSAVRSLLQRGAVHEVSQYLGRAYSIEGSVIKGKGRGQSILHIPTANITTPVEIAPREGVYAVKVNMRGTVYNGVANIGKNPTFGNENVSYEVHLFSFSGNLLGANIRIYFIDRIRGERTFPDPVSLEKQIRDDIEYAKNILNPKNEALRTGPRVHE